MKSVTTGSLKRRKNIMECFVFGNLGKLKNRYSKAKYILSCQRYPEVFKKKKIFFSLSKPIPWIKEVVDCILVGSLLPLRSLYCKNGLSLNLIIIKFVQINTICKYIHYRKESKHNAAKKIVPEVWFELNKIFQD